MHFSMLISDKNMCHVFSVKSEGVELMHEVVLVGVLVVVLLHAEHVLRHAVIYAKKLSLISWKRVLFLFGFFAETPPYDL